MGRGSSRRYGTGRSTLLKVQDGLGIIGEVWNGLEDPPGGLLQVQGPSWRSGMGHGSSRGSGKVQDWCGNTQ